MMVCLLDSRLGVVGTLFRRYSVAVEIGGLVLVTRN
jgi:hypothetical protein